MFERMRKSLGDESGSVAIEYGLIAGLVGVAIVTAVTQAGARAGAIFAFLQWAIGPAAQ